nr:MAG TPA_asm: hypothetical protein [Caudoviricetes sp.]
MPLPVRGTTWLLCALLGARAIPARSLWAIGACSALLILCSPSGVPLAYFVRPLRTSSACLVGQLVRCSAIPSAIPSAY